MKMNRTEKKKAEKRMVYHNAAGWFWLSTARVLPGAVNSICIIFMNVSLCGKGKDWKKDQIFLNWGRKINRSVQYNDHWGHREMDKIKNGLSQAEAAGFGEEPLSWPTCPWMVESHRAWASWFFWILSADRPEKGRTGEGQKRLLWCQALFFPP